MTPQDRRQAMKRLCLHRLMWLGYDFPTAAAVLGPKVGKRTYHAACRWVGGKREASRIRKNLKRTLKRHGPSPAVFGLRSPTEW